MSVPISSPSSLLRQQIKNISMSMRTITEKAVLSPLRNITGFSKVKARFARTEDEAYQSCSLMDKEQSIVSADRATKATYELMARLTQLKNEARKLVENGDNVDLSTQFHEQLDNVEILMNASILPFIQNTYLSKVGSRQALETLERWSELYRHGLMATGNIPECGEEWLKEAHKRLNLSAEALRQLDNNNEAMATKSYEST